MKISVIIPVYNIENYLRDTLNSLLNQTYKDFEIILINDGSKDKSAEICDYYANKYDFINVVHKSNGGVSSARNYGLDIARGEWIFFLDGDDILLENAFETLIKIAHKSKYDIIEGNYIRIQNGEKIYTPIIDEHFYEENSYDCIKNTLLYNRYLIIPRLFKKEIIGKSRFKEGIVIGEDILFIIELLLHKNIKLAHSKDIVYHYIHRKGSAMHNKETMNHYDVLSNKMIELISSNKEYTEYLILFCCINIYFKAVKSGQNISLYDYEKYFKGNFELFWNNKLLATKFKLLFISYSINRQFGDCLLKIRSKLFAKY